MKIELNLAETALHRIKSAVVNRVGNRVREIDVRLTGNNGDTALVVSGISRTYYGKQLAQHGLFDLFDEPGHKLFEALGINHKPQIVNEIEVI